MAPPLDALARTPLAAPDSMHESEPSFASLEVPGILAVVNDRRNDDRRGHRTLGARVGDGERRRDHRERRKGDRRGFARLAIELPVEERCGNETYWRVTQDLSVLGLSMKFATPHPPRTMVSLRFTLPDDEEGEYISTHGLVTTAIAGGEGMRVKFVALDAKHARRIGRFVAAAQREQKKLRK